MSNEVDDNNDSVLYRNEPRKLKKRMDILRLLIIVKTLKDMHTSTAVPPAIYLPRVYRTFFTKKVESILVATPHSGQTIVYETDTA